LAVVLADGLRSGDAVRVIGAFPAERIAALRAEAERAHRDGAFATARIGRARSTDAATRGDEICWCDGMRDAPASAALLVELEALRVALDRALLLGAQSVEAHHSRYGIGTHYARHLDRFAGDASGRVLSLVLYLNENWCDADGGALRLYDAAGLGHDIWPAGGDLVAFLSDRVAHEVLPAKRPRRSIAAWFTRA